MKLFAISIRWTDGTTFQGVLNAYNANHALSLVYSSGVGSRISTISADRL